MVFFVVLRFDVYRNPFPGEIRNSWMSSLIKVWVAPLPERAHCQHRLRGLTPRHGHSQPYAPADSMYSTSILMIVTLHRFAKARTDDF